MVTTDVKEEKSETWLGPTEVYSALVNVEDVIINLIDVIQKKGLQCSLLIWDT